LPLCFQEIKGGTRVAYRECGAGNVSRLERKEMNGAKNKLADVETPALTVAVKASVLPLTTSVEPRLALLNATESEKAWRSQAAREGRGTERLNRYPTMTCRIERLFAREDLVILRVSGRIAGEYVNMLRACLEEERSVVAIDLKEAYLVDREAVKLLALSESNGVELRNCSAYIREWVTRERADMNAPEQGIEGREDTKDV
jgi:hypothetical protein